ncbi:MAG: hypothetical protein OEU54_01470 [Gemmatimonadota bacterium]|nr:hypothetical protein [Gemmatimonadota bacterium]
MREWSLAIAVTLAVPAASWGQDANMALPVDQLEEIMSTGDFQVVSVTTSRGLPSERTYQITAQAGNAMIQMKYAPAARGADEFNNRPRYELAAYEIQKLFLDPEHYAVPPTRARAFPRSQVQGVLDMLQVDYKPEAESTFGDWDMTLVLLQYWLWNVEVPDELDDGDRQEDDVYATHLGNFNLVTYLIRHNDSNEGNFLRSTVAESPRIFSVDNGVAFSNEESNRGFYWRDVQVDRFPAESIERLRSITEDELQAALGTVAEFELQGGQFVQVPSTENMNPGRGVRAGDGRIQLGLTESEVRQMYRRLERLIGWIDGGRYTVF